MCKIKVLCEMIFTALPSVIFILARSLAFYKHSVLSVYNYLYVFQNAWRSVVSCRFNCSFYKSFFSISYLACSSMVNFLHIYYV